MITSELSVHLGMVKLHPEVHSLREPTTWVLRIQTIPNSPDISKTIAVFFVNSLDQIKTFAAELNAAILQQEQVPT